MDRKRLVLILAPPDDAHALYIQGVLTDARHVVRILDTARCPADFALSYGPQSNSARIEFPDGPVLDWNDIHSIYWRKFVGAGSGSEPGARKRAAWKDDFCRQVESMLFALPGKWVNSYRAWSLYESRPAQLAKVCSLKTDPAVKNPRTLLSNSYRELKAFAQSVGKCVFTPVRGGDKMRLLTDEQLGADKSGRPGEPITVQEYIDGTDVRVFVAGRKVMACRIETDTYDFRDDPDAKVAPHALSEEVSDACVRIARALSLVWAGIDLKLTSKGEYFFIEADPSPEFMAYESCCRLPLTETLIDLLVK